MKEIELKKLEKSIKQFNPISQLMQIVKNVNIDKETENIIMNSIVEKAQNRNLKK